MTHVIAIAGPPGAGKSTFAHALADLLGDSVVLEFDRYEKATAQSVDDLTQWLRDGADFNALAAPRLRADLESLKHAQPPRKYLIFETPLGREHEETAPLIDLLVWIDLPLDIALARNLREITGSALRSPTSAEYGKALMWLNRYLDSYLAVVREVLVIQQSRVRPGADILIDGLANFSDLAAQTAQLLRQHLP